MTSLIRSCWLGAIAAFLAVAVYATPAAAQGADNCGIDRRGQGRAGARGARIATIVAGSRAFGNELPGREPGGRTLRSRHARWRTLQGER